MVRFLGKTTGVRVPFIEAIQLAFLEYGRRRRSSAMVNLQPILNHRFPIGEWETAFDTFVDRNDDAIQVLIKP